MVWMMLWVSGAQAKKPKCPEPQVVECPPAPSQAKMDNERLAVLFRTVAPEDSRKAPNYWEMTLHGVPIVVVTDEAADRMRIMAPVAQESELTGPMALRLLQANFDSALDARYSVAQGTVWATFIHPLSPLSDAELASGLAQVLGCATTYGTSFTSGALVFGGGDSAAIHAEAYQEFLEKMEIEDGMGI